MNLSTKKGDIITATYEDIEKRNENLKSGKNSPPQANPDGYTGNEDVTLKINAPGVLSNDLDDDGPQSLTAHYNNDISKGSLTFNDDGSFEYSTLENNWFGLVTFTYYAYDGNENSESVKVEIYIQSVNDPPEVLSIPDQTIDEDSTFTLFDLDMYVNDNDPIDVISWEYSGNSALDVDINEDNEATITIISQGWNGIETITFTASDGYLSDYDEVIFTVENLQTIGIEDSYSVIKNNILTIEAPGILSNDIDVDELSAVLNDDVSHGILTLNPDGSFVYQPDGDWLGEDTFSYRAFDGDVYSEETLVTIHVKGRPEPPSPYF
jgi:hypothetical protein